MAVLTCEKLNYRYSVGTPFETAALQDVSFSVEEGEIVGIIGHTGSGKSTLIQHLNGLIEPQSGKVYVDGADIWSKQNRKQIRRVRFQVGLCFQYPEYQIFEEDVYKEIAFGPKQMGLDSEEIRRRVFHSMELVGLSRDFAEQSPFDLSGGQKRRVAIASILAMEPKVLILDEPCAGLDPRGRDQILDLIRSYRDRGNGAFRLPFNGRCGAHLPPRAGDAPRAGGCLRPGCRCVRQCGGTAPNGAECAPGNGYFLRTAAAWRTVPHRYFYG